jgi:predicted ATPase/signal transduction histidine kinase
MKTTIHEPAAIQNLGDSEPGGGGPPLNRPAPDGGHGDKDQEGPFVLPDLWFGRESQLEFLKQTYTRTRYGEGSVIIIKGNPGIGKTELVNRFGAYVRSSGGIFLAGKFERNGNPVPASGPRKALADLGQWLLSRPSGAVSSWRDKILSAVSPNGQIVIDLIPELENVIGKQDPPCDLPPIEANLRVSMVMDKFGSLFLTKDHPVVYFLDDLQWADKDSLDLCLGFLVAKNRRYLMAVGTYRDTEVDDNHPVAHFLGKIRRTSIPCEAIAIDPFDLSETGSMVSNILKTNPGSVTALAGMVHDTSGGNPFVIRQFMKSLADQGLIRFDSSRQSWTCESEGIGKTGTGDILANLLGATLSRLEGPTLIVLQAASCSGNRIDRDLLTRVLDVPLEFVDHHIGIAVQTGILRRKESDSTVVEFIHDHMLHAVYQTFDEDKAGFLHWKTGKAMAMGLKNGAGHSIFDTVAQFRKGQAYVVSPMEKTGLAEMNLTAGQRAMETISFKTASEYLRDAASLLPGNCWETRYILAWEIHSRTAKCEFVMGNYSESERLFNLVLEKSRTVLDKIRTCNAMVELFTTRGDIHKALAIGRTGLGLLGMQTPPSPGKLRLILLLGKLRLIWAIKSVPGLLSDPSLKKEEPLATTLSLISSMGFPAFYVNPRLCLWLIIKGCFLGLENPEKDFPAEHAAYGLVALGAMIGSMFGFHQMGGDYTRTGHALMARFPVSPHQPMAHFVSAFYGHFTEPAVKSVEHIRKAYRLALKVGNIGYAGHSINVMFLSRMFTGDDLDDIHTYHKRHAGFITGIDSQFITSTYRVLDRFYLCLKGRTESPVSLDGEGFRVDDYFRTALRQGNMILSFVVLLVQLKLHVLYRQWVPAMAIAERFDSFAQIPEGSLILAEFYFYMYMAATPLIKDMPRGKKLAALRKRMAVCMGKMKKWAVLCPENFRHTLILMEAEKAAARNRAGKALSLYRKAIEQSKDTGYTHITAMACEHAGRFLFKRNDTISGRSYIEEAGRYYALWGATAKTGALEKEYPFLSSSGAFPSRSLQFSPMDMVSLTNALRSISEEIVVRKLLVRLMRIIVENTGADRVVFISHKNGRLFMEVESRGLEWAGTRVMDEQLVEAVDSPISWTARHVQSTLKPVVLDSGCSESIVSRKIGEFNNPPRSLLSLPMLRKDHLVGILYLEHSFKTGLFTKDRVEFVRMIAAQTAISYENATLYEHVIKNERDLDTLSRKLRSLHSQLLFTEENQRRQIASDLHDRIGHALATVKMGLQSMTGTLDEKNRETAGTLLAAIDQSITDTRSLVFELSPPVLYHFGLGAALEWLCEETRKKHGIRVTFTDLSPENNRRTEPGQNTAILCFQAVRELVFNAVKHARAGSIDVMLDIRETIRLRVLDNGQGFDMDNRGITEERNRGFGLFGISERLQLIGGTMAISTSLGKGVLVTMDIPCDGMEDERETTPDEQVYIVRKSVKGNEYEYQGHDR